MVALALEDLELEYSRQVGIGPKNQVVDFLVANRVYLEIDGEYHKTATGVQQDLIKEKAIRRTGLPLLRVTTQDVEQRLEEVVQKIRQALELPPSSLLPLQESKLSGTSRLKTTRAT